MLKMRVNRSLFKISETYTEHVDIRIITSATDFALYSENVTGKHYHDGTALNHLLMLSIETKKLPIVIFIIRMVINCLSYQSVL